MIIDMTDDNGKYLEDFFSSDGSFERPDFMKSASFEASVRPGASAFDEDYALALTTDAGAVRKYPVMTKGAALASAAYFAHYGVNNLPDDLCKLAARRLRTALEGYGFEVQGAIAKLAAESGDLPTTSNTFYDSQSWARKENPTPSLLDLFGTEGFEATHEGDSLSPSGKSRLWFSVKEAGLRVPDEALDYTSTQFGSDLKLCLDARKTCVPEDSAKSELDDIYKMASDRTVAEVVDALEAFDISHGIQNHWGRFFPDPYVSVVGNSIEKAASAGETVSVGDQKMSHDELVSAISSNMDTIKEKFGGAISDELEKDPVGVYNSLPIDYKDALTNVLT